MANIDLGLSLTLFEDELEVWYSEYEEQPELTVTLSDLFEGYAENLKGGYSVQEAEQYVLTTIKALEQGKKELLNALEDMKARIK